MIQPPAFYLSNKTSSIFRVFETLLGEEKIVLDIAETYSNRYAFGIAAN